MNQSPEEIFYSSQQVFSGPAAPISETAQMFAAGGRYTIVTESLSNDKQLEFGSVAELGCGKGDKLLYVQKRFGFREAVGIDLCFSQPIFNAMEGHQFFAANLNQAWPLQDDSIDVLIAMMLLEHLFDPYASFREIERVLKPNGRAFVNLPLITSIKNRLRLLLGRIPVTSVPYKRWQKEGHWDGFHLHYFTLAAIQDLANYAGLNITLIRAVGRFHGVKNQLPGLLCDEISFELRHGN